MDIDRSVTTSCIGVIYGGTRGTGTPTFWTEGYGAPTFRDENCHLLSKRSDLRRLNDSKTIFGRDSAADDAGRAHDALSDTTVE